ncbi:GrpB family protein [Reinekea marinisedimentorum]|uniref:GrpB-like predicted nucleotidyltransferase (UPF0157 family) n=1 Tax=Reinekea marinisedimentorum TaxID=230495 RepID=A0A4R3HQX1_9GAMM|nr:GrpB family protein [Reinekea marinisedimentorum]TCS34669.1 GrpB-like predicted nucleotidyltransferase (UPF0157 family) [Reinekea marinisedimentorum]
MPKIEIIEPRITWKNEFEEIRKDLVSILEGFIMCIDHIGSTSVPHLPAKNVIDVQVTVSDLNKPYAKEQLIDAGYNYRIGTDRDSLVGFDEDSEELKKLFFMEKPSSRRCHIHIREYGRENQRYPLLFRDYLIADSTTREAYALVKKELAIRFPDDPDAYYAIKDPYMDTIYRAACMWAEKTGWTSNGGLPTHVTSE